MPCRRFGYRYLKFKLVGDRRWYLSERPGGFVDDQQSPLVCGAGHSDAATFRQWLAVRVYEIMSYRIILCVEGSLSVRTQ